MSDSPRWEQESWTVSDEAVVSIGAVRGEGAPSGIPFVDDYFWGRVSVLDSEGDLLKTYPVRPDAVSAFRIEDASPDGNLLVRVIEEAPYPTVVGLAGAESLVWICLDPATTRPPDAVGFPIRKNCAYDAGATRMRDVRDTNPGPTRPKKEK